MTRVPVRGYYRNGHWVRPHTRRVHGKSQAGMTRSYLSISPGKGPQASNRTASRYPTSDQRRVERDREEQRRQKRIEDAATYCASAVKTGLVAATADEVADRVSRGAWDALSSRWSPIRCRWLADLAQLILDSKAQYHRVVSRVVVAVSFRLLRLPGHGPERTFSRELLSSLMPLPGDEHFLALAHGLRVAGVGLCVAQDLPLSGCACFQPLALEATKEKVKEFLTSEGNRWMQGPEKEAHLSFAAGNANPQSKHGTG